VNSALLLNDKIGIVAGAVSLIQWVVFYSYQERWWRHQLGWSLVIKTLLVAALLLLLALSVFFRLNRLDSQVVAWLSVVFVYAITPVMWWRTLVWTREYRQSPRYERRRTARAMRRADKVRARRRREGRP
jgi:uncharacterized membrane protein YfcA